MRAPTGSSSRSICIPGTLSGNSELTVTPPRTRVGKLPRR
jgi:hypothetical protein